MIEFYFLGESRCCIDQNHTIHLKIKQKIYLIQNHTLFSSTQRACFSVCVCVCESSCEQFSCCARLFDHCKSGRVEAL